VRPPGVDVVKASHTERQSSLWVRGAVPLMPDGWREEALPLEELVITYLSVPGAAALPRPEVEEVPA
jgi:ABC-2 type transport system ATP-binding protein